jgi:hypothetical protein
MAGSGGWSAVLLLLLFGCFSASGVFSLEGLEMKPSDVPSPAEINAAVQKFGAGEDLGNSRNGRVTHEDLVASEAGKDLLKTFGARLSSKMKTTGESSEKMLQK